MPEIAHPERWTVFAFLLVSMTYGISTLVREWRRRNAEDRERQRRVLSPWLGLSAEEQAARDREALDAYETATEHAAEAAERIVREAASLLSHLYD